MAGIDFDTREQLEAWLRDKPRSFAVVIAARAALRVEEGIVLLPEETWTAGPAAVNAAIKVLIASERAVLGEAAPAIVDPGAGPIWEPDAQGENFTPRPRLTAMSENDWSDFEAMRPHVLAALEDLIAAAKGSRSNATAQFMPRVEAYRAALNLPRDAISIDAIHAGAVRLRNAHQRFSSAVIDEGLPDLAADIGEPFDSAIGLQGPMILATARGRDLNQRARDDTRTRADELAYRE